ncbi:MAG: NAD(P)-dependent oxidoreductase [bacterium]|nr:NAD(P)-dependent oxidoreductase [bacterium]
MQIRTVAFYGAGMLGSGFVKSLRRQGFEVNVWNRSAEKATALEAVGARAFEHAAEAARDADIVHLCVRDDAAVDAILDAALPGLRAGVPVVDHTTVLPQGVVGRAQRLAAAGHPFLHAPVFMGPPQSESATGTMLASGSQALLAELEPHLAKMTGKVVNLSERTDLAAVYKLMGNLMILATIGGLDDLFTFAQANGVAKADAYKLFGFYSPQGQIDGRGKKMAHGEYDALWTVDMALKDANLMRAGAAGATLAVVDAVVGRLEATIAKGDGQLDLGAISR